MSKGAQEEMAGVTQTLVLVRCPDAIRRQHSLCKQFRVLVPKMRVAGAKAKKVALVFNSSGVTDFACKVVVSNPTQHPAAKAPAQAKLCVPVQNCCAERQR
jgi:hypothetical protein